MIDKRAFQTVLRALGSTHGDTVSTRCDAFILSQDRVGFCSDWKDACKIQWMLKIAVSTRWEKRKKKEKKKEEKIWISDSQLN